jgi:hypothetical protein
MHCPEPAILISQGSGTCGYDVAWLGDVAPVTQPPTDTP